MNNPDEGLDGLIVLNSKEMEHDEFCGSLDRVIVSSLEKTRA